MNRRWLLIAVLMCAISVAKAATLLVYDPFTDGSRSNITGGDLQGLVYYMGQTSSTLTFTNDSNGIGTGNALFFNPAAGSGFQKFLAYIPTVTLTNPGDSITVTFNYRFLVPPTNINAGLRMGLYNSNGTHQTNDASDTGVPGPGDRSDDVGYGFQSNPGSNSTTGLNVYSEAAGNDILGGASPSQTGNQGSAGWSFNSGTNAHFAFFQMSLQPNGNLGLLSYIDNGIAAYASIPAASVFTNSFDEWGLEEGGTGFSVPLLIDNLTMVTTTSNDFDPLRTNWWQLQSGGSNYSLSDSLVKSALSSLTNTALGYWNSMDKTGTNTYLWSDLTSTTDSGEISSAYQRLLYMAQAYATYGSAMRSNATLAANIQTGLNWMYTNRYNVNIPATSGEYDNWYDWEIGAPLEIVDIAVYMYDALGITGLSNTLNAVDHFVPSPFSGTSGTSTGGNLSDKTRIVAVRGAVVKDASKLTLAANAFSSLFLNVTNGDGFYNDGSFIQHTRNAYTGSYGLVAIQDTSLVLPWLTGTSSQYATNTGQTNVIIPWRCTDPNFTNVMQWVYDSYQPLIYYGEMMDMTRGRAMSRYSDEAHTAGANCIQSLLRLANSAFPMSSDSSQVKSMVKYWAQVDTYRNFTNTVPLPLITPTEQLMADTNTAPRGELTGHWTFASMDRVVHLRPGWGLGVSMSSTRIYDYESINSENLHGWFEGDGVTYIYVSGDEAQFSSGFWPTVDPYSLPGTTTDTAALANSAGEATLTTKNWVGGVTLLTNGSAGLDLAPVNNPLTGKKSYFMFDNEVVCLGAGITDTGTSDVHTTAINRKISSSNTNTFTLNGTNQSTTLAVQTNSFTNVSWCTLGGFGGCWFPGGATLNGVRQARTNSWSQINAGGTTSQVVNNFLTLWFDHGVKPTNASYSYVVLPNYSSTQTSNYASAPQIVVLTNSTNVQAVKETNISVVAANFWQDGASSADIISVDHKSAVMTQQTSNMIYVAVSDPTQTNTQGINVTLATGAYSIVSCDPAITVTQIQPTIQMSVNTSNTFGRSLVASFYTANLPPYWTGTPSGSVNPGGVSTINLSNYVSDPDLPYQTLSFSLLSSPSNATVNPVSGVFTWQSSLSQAGTTNSFLAKVTDNGSPSMSAVKPFSVTVYQVPLMNLMSGSNGQVSLAISASVGSTYALQTSMDLINWTNLFTTNQTMPVLNWTDTPPTNVSRRFYRVVLTQ